MAPLPESTLTSYITSLLARSTSSAILLPRSLQKRATDPSSGVTPPSDIPNQIVFVLFGLIGAGFVISGIWFFFWAKNGGFVFHENDWEDYKSTVLRRRGPNGTILSGATEETDLGGGSVVHGEGSEKRSVWGGKKKGRGKKGGKKAVKEERYKDFEWDEQTEYTGAGTESLADHEVHAMKAAAKKSKNAKKDKKSRKPRPEDEMSEVATTVLGTDLDPNEAEEMDVSVRADLRDYRREKPARVGGLNRQADGSAFDGSTADTASSAHSDLLSHREKTPTSTPTKSRREHRDRVSKEGYTGGIRKVVSTSEGTGSYYSREEPEESGARKKKSLIDTSREAHIKAEAQRLQDKGRAAQKRDFSFRIGDDGTSSSVTGSALSGSTATSSPSGGGGSTVADRAERERQREVRREERERRRKSRSPEKKVPGGYVDEGSVLGSLVSEESGDIGTKSYHHPIPGLSSDGGSAYGGSGYADERRKKRAGERSGAGGATGGRGGYRRGNADDLD